MRGRADTGHKDGAALLKGGCVGLESGSEEEHVLWALESSVFEWRIMSVLHLQLVKAWPVL